MQRQTVFDIWRTNKDANDVYMFVIDHFNLKDCDDNVKTSVRKTIETLCVHLKAKWKRSSYSYSNFIAKNSKYLESDIPFDDIVVNAALVRRPGTSNESFRSATREAGRPKIPFKESSEKTKRRKVETLVQQGSPEELTFAARVSLQAAGRRDAAEVVKQVDISPKRASKIKKMIKSPGPQSPIKLSPDQALAFYVDTKLTRHQYISMRKVGIAQKANIYPCYDKIIASKKNVIQKISVLAIFVLK